MTPPSSVAPAPSGIMAPGIVCGGFFSPAFYNGGLLGYNGVEGASNMGAPQFHNYGTTPATGGQRGWIRA